MERFDPKKMQAIVERLKAEGRLPSPEAMQQLLGLLRPEWQRTVKAIRETGSLPPRDRKAN